MKGKLEVENESHEKKVKFEGEVKCPHCGFFLVVKAGKKIIKASTPAVTEDFFTVEESTQSKLETGISVKEDKNIKAEPSEKKRRRPKKENND